MKTHTHAFGFFISALFCLGVFSSPLKGGSELRLALGDPLQEIRTTSVNWPRLAENTKPAVVPRAVSPRLFRVMVDVGHGGHDLGAVAQEGIVEKEVCLRIATEVRSRLERIARLSDFPIEVKLSRDSDYFIGLKDRTKEANDWGADLFISVHANSSPAPRARGFEVYFLANDATDAEAQRVAKQENTDATQRVASGVLSILSDLKTNSHILESSRFAESVYTALAEKLRPNGKGVRQAPFAVLSGTAMPALLIEVGYLTHPEEAAALSRKSYQHRVAASIAEGVLDYALRVRRIGRLPPPIRRFKTT
jgi:N-acetylmuramoyl-L-alanine amidase